MMRVSWKQVAADLQRDSTLRSQLLAELRSSPHAALYFETAPVSRATADGPFEHVLLESPALAGVHPDPSPFSRRFTPGEPVATFANRGGDAVLVVPSPGACPVDAGAHLAVFTRLAPEPLVRALWAEVGRAVEQWWAEREDPVWVSTSGLGVHWLHVRLDSWPKYYQHAAFRQFSGR